ncbi:MAG: nodulation protein NfeD, partial [Candidatus Aminicenantes bacterium]|nr:nodulation protein NfeD [Candidatus Aminicenantes bacterium]
MRKAWFICFFVFSFLIVPLLLNGDVYHLEIKGPIDSIAEEYLLDSYEKINTSGNGELVILSIDTPGGFSTSMRSIIKAIMNSKIPTAVYVSPS